MIPAFGVATGPAPRTYNVWSADEDRLLWREFKNGSQAALSEIYQRHAGKLYQYGLLVCKDHELALDCVQELFSRLWSRRQRMTDVHCVHIYLYKSFQRMLVRELVNTRKQTKKPIAEGEAIPSFEDSIIEHESKINQCSRLKESLLSLSRGQREVILLRYFNELSYPEISEIMEMHVGSVYNLASKAMENLRQKLSVSQGAPQAC